MINKERLIKAWKIFQKSNPYEICKGREFQAIKEPEYCMGQMISDTIALLEEQEPKTGHWIFESRYNDIWSNICSECGRLMTTATGSYANYCSNCGAKMTGGEAE